MKKILSLLLALALCAGLGVPALADVYEDPTAAAIDAIHRTLEAAGISDVPLSSPFAPAVAWAVENNITKGTTPTTFGPGNTCTTSHILTFLWRAAGRPGDAGEERAAVSAWAFGLGINVSDLSTPCTRAAAVMDIWKAQGSPAAKEAASFTDVAPSAPYAGAVSWAVEAGVTNGTGGGAFSPEAVCTRGQIVTFLYRALGGSVTAPAETPREQTPAAGSGTLANGKPITEENVLAMLYELYEQYPGSTDPNSRTYTPVGQAIPTKVYTPIFGDTVVNARECAGWAAFVSDYIFGKDAPSRAHKNYYNAKPGDILYAEGHKSVVIDAIYMKDSTQGQVLMYLTTDSGSSHEVDWGWDFEPGSMGSLMGTPSGYSSWNADITVITRYPDDSPSQIVKDAPPPLHASSHAPSGSKASRNHSALNISSDPESEPGEGVSSGNSSSGSTPIPSGIHVDTDSPCGVCGKVSDNYVYSDDFARHVCLDCWNDPSGVGKWFIE